MRFVITIAAALTFAVAMGAVGTLGVADAQQKPKCADCY